MQQQRGEQGAAMGTAHGQWRAGRVQDRDRAE
jgi:hypothetical protein